MKRRISNLFMILLFGSIVIFINSCEKETYYPPTEVKELHTLMDEWYYWIDSIADVDPSNYTNPYDLLEAMRFTHRDKWSYITTQEAHSQYYDEGTYVGYGFSYSLDEEDNLRITFTFEESDFRIAGIDRGWIIRKINGQSVDGNASINALLGAANIGVSNDFEFESPTGETLSQTFTKKLITMNTVGYDDIIEIGSKKVGYFVFKSFIGPSINELNEVFDRFQGDGVNELVIDLRYNGGGQLDVVEHLAGLIIPDNISGEIFYKIVHNNDRTDQNETAFFEQTPRSLKLNKVYFITSQQSASASEVIINCLEPYIDVIMVGDDSYGKPVGMYSVLSKVSNLVYVPVSFKILNAANFGGYYNGLPADSYVSDDLSSNFGLGEDVFDEVLYHIENGSFSSLKSSFDIYRKPFKEIRNLKDEIGAI